MFARCPDTYKVLAEGQQTSHTGRPLLPGWTESVTHCVAMAGARASGKSLYIAVLVKQLELLTRQRFPHHTFEAADASTRSRYIEKYETPLYHQMRHMAATPRGGDPGAYQKDPFIFSLGRWPAPDGHDREHYLVIRDVAGEDLESPDPNGADMEFFQYADLVIFLFDPLKVPSIATYLRGLIPPQQQLGGNPEDVFRTVLSFIGEGRPKLAVTVSKFDTLQALNQLEDNQWKQIMGNFGAAFRRDTGWNYLPMNQRVLHLEIESLLRLMDAHNLINTIERTYVNAPARHAYFAVSALGESPRGENIDRKGIAPYRVLDPLRWHLSEFGVFTDYAGAS